jgi:hypothetical protein
LIFGEKTDNNSEIIETMSESPSIERRITPLLDLSTLTPTNSETDLNENENASKSSEMPAEFKTKSDDEPTTPDKKARVRRGRCDSRTLLKQNGFTDDEILQPDDLEVCFCLFVCLISKHFPLAICFV